VALASPAGGFSTDFLAVKTVDVVLEPLALLHGTIEIDQLELSEPVVNFEVDKAGQRNWVFRPEAAPRPAAALPARNAPAPSFTAGDVTIANGTVSYLDQRDGLKRSAGGVDLALSFVSLDGPLRGVGTAVYNGQTVNVGVTVASPGNLRDRRASAATVDIASAHGSFRFQGTIDRGDAATTTGTVDFKTPSLRDLLAWAQIAGKMDFDGSKLMLADTTVAFDGLTASGPIELTHTDGRFIFDFEDMASSGARAWARSSSTGRPRCPRLLYPCVSSASQRINCRSTLPGSTR
jgi:AsmA protein